VSFVRSAAELERCPAAVFWRGGFYEDLRVVEVTGSTWKIGRVSIRWPAGSLARRVVHWLDLPLALDLEFLPDVPISPGELRTTVERAIEEDPEALEELSRRDVGWWREAIDRSTSVADVVRAFESGFRSRA
jgi:hypothetical protein